MVSFQLLAAAILIQGKIGFVRFELTHALRTGAEPVSGEEIVVCQAHDHDGSVGAIGKTPVADEKRF